MEGLLDFIIQRAVVIGYHHAADVGGYSVLKHFEFQRRHVMAGDTSTLSARAVWTSQSRS